MLQTYIQNILPMPKEKANAIGRYFQEVEIPKHSLLLEEGQISTKSYFVEAGFIRSYIVDLAGDEATTRIYAPPDFANDYLSFFKKSPAQENIITVTDCKVKTITFEDLQYCFHNIPEFREFGRMLLTLNYTKMYQRMLAMHTQTAEDRYSHLLNQHPDIIQNVPLKHIASYLGITDSSLSRIRKKLADHS